MSFIDRFTTPKDVEQQRLAICNGCEHKTAIGVCAKCGCVVKAKVKVRVTSCPIGKWKNHEDTDSK